MIDVKVRVNYDDGRMFDFDVPCAMVTDHDRGQISLYARSHRSITGLPTGTIVSTTVVGISGERSGPMDCDDIAPTRGHVRITQNDVAHFHWDEGNPVVTMSEGMWPLFK